MRTGRLGRQDRQPSLWKSRERFPVERACPVLRRLGIEVLEDRRMLSVRSFPAPPDPLEPLYAPICESSFGADTPIAGGTHGFTIEPLLGPLQDNGTVTVDIGAFELDEDFVSSTHNLCRFRGKKWWSNWPPHSRVKGPLPVSGRDRRALVQLKDTSITDCRYYSRNVSLC
jgi:hypothetical protein